MDMLRTALPGLSDAKRKAAVFALENPDRFGPRSVREVAAEAGFPPTVLFACRNRLAFPILRPLKRP